MANNKTNMRQGAGIPSAPYIGVVRPIRKPVGLVVHYTSGTPADNIERIEVIYDDLPMDQQIKRADFNIQRISGIYMYASEEDVVANKDVIYSIYREDDMYLMEDLYHEFDFHPCYGDEVYIVGDYIYKGIIRCRVSKLYANQPIDVQLKKKRLKNVYFCTTRAFAVSLRDFWNSLRAQGRDPHNSR